jgi:tetratricopeptide (TPR) repeat protein
MPRKKKPSPSVAITDQPVESVPVVTPEIADGYNGIVKRLVCAACQRIFYLTEADYHALHPTHCHPCSTRLVADDEAKRQQEITEQEQQIKRDIVMAIFADLNKPLDDTPEEAFVRARVETKSKADWKYGFKMLLCVPHHSENGRMWHVVLTKDEEHPHRSIHVRLLLIEISENFHMFLPYDKSIYDGEKPKPTMEALEQAIEREPTRASAYTAKAERLVELGEDQQALQWYDQALALEASIYTYCSKGDVLARLDLTGEAMTCYEQAISLEPDDTYGYTHKARLLEHLGREEEALALYDAYIAAHPTDLKGYLRKALFYASQDRYEEARQIHAQGKLAAQQVN